jgi:hypothetical protein
MWGRTVENAARDLALVDGERSGLEVALADDDLDGQALLRDEVVEVRLRLARLELAVRRVGPGRDGVSRVADSGMDRQARTCGSATSWRSSSPRSRCPTCAAGAQWSA